MMLILDMVIITHLDTLHILHIYIYILISPNHVQCTKSLRRIELLRGLRGALQQRRLLRRADRLRPGRHGGLGFLEILGILRLHVLGAESGRGGESI